MKVENEFLTLELEKLKLKYSNLKKTFHKKTLEHTVAEARNPPVPKLNLPTPNLPANESECDTPRSSSSVSNSVYVVPIPVFDIDDDGDAAKQSPSTVNNFKGRLVTQSSQLTPGSASLKSTVFAIVLDRFSSRCV